MLYFIFFELFLPIGALVHHYQQDFCALLLKTTRSWLLDIFVILWSRSWRERKIRDLLWTRSCRRRKSQQEHFEQPLGAIALVDSSGSRGVPHKKIIYGFGFNYPSLRFLNPLIPPSPFGFVNPRPSNRTFPTVSQRLIVFVTIFPPRRPFLCEFWI